MSKNVLIVGTGLGGIAAALRLVKRGYKIQMVEKNKQAGGRLNEIIIDGFRFDMGPTFFSMSYEFDELIRDSDINLPFTLKELEPLYAVNFTGTEKSYYIYKDLDKLSEQFTEIEPGFKVNIKKYLDSTEKFYKSINQPVVHSNFDSKADFLFKLTKVPVIFAPKLFYSMWQEVCKYFSSYEVRTIMSLVAFFLGSSPFETMSVYNILNYTKLVHDGYHIVEGGTYKIVESLVKILEDKGVSISYNTEIIDYKAKNNKLSGLIDQDGNVWESDIYVINADAALFRNKIFKRNKYNEKRLAGMKWSMAPFTMYLGLNTKINNIYFHHYFLGDNFEEYSRKVFKNAIKLDRPYYYVNLLSYTDRNSAPDGCESIFILCPVADLRFKKHWDDKEELADNIITDLSRRTGFDIKSRIIAKVILTPLDWQNLFNLYMGSGLGLAHNFRQIGAFRPKNYDEVYDNTFYVGSSTIPGTGLPMAIISSKLVVERIINKYGSLS